MIDLHKINAGDVVAFRSNGAASVEGKMVKGDKVRLWFTGGARTYNRDGHFVDDGEHIFDIVRVVVKR